MIRINLLAEAQAAEELRRRDPVKWASVGCGVLVGLVGLWAFLLQGKVNQSSEALRKTQSQWDELKKKDDVVKTNLFKTGVCERKLAALAKLSTNRFLWSAPMNALQFCIIDTIQLTEIRNTQSYVTNEAKIDPDTKQVIKPAMSTETISIQLSGNDFVASGSGSHTEFMKAILANSYFQATLNRTNTFTAVARFPRAGGESGEAAKGAGFTFKCQLPPQSRW
jgi:hypothetical protein